MGLSSSAVDLEHFGSSKEVMINSNNQPNNPSNGEQYKLYETLNRMGFDNQLVLQACDKYKQPQQLENAITYVLSQKKSLIVSSKQSAGRSFLSSLNDHNPTLKSTDRDIFTENNIDKYHNFDSKSDILTSGELEIDEDGYYKLITNKDSQSLIQSLTPQALNNNKSKQSLIEDEVIKFHMELHKESIEDIRAINNMAEEYEQKRIYTEMLEMEEKNNIKQCIYQIQQNLQILQTSFYKQCQLLYQNYQIKIIQNKDINIELLQNQFQMQIVMLKENYLKQKEFLDENKNKLQQLFDSYNKKYDIVSENEETSLKNLNVNDVPQYIPSSINQKNNDCDV